MNSLNDGINFLKIKEKKYSLLNNKDLKQQNSSGYESIVESLENLSSVSPLMNIDINSPEVKRFNDLENLFNSKLSSYKNIYDELSNTSTIEDNESRKNEVKDKISKLNELNNELVIIANEMIKEIDILTEKNKINPNDNILYKKKLEDKMSLEIETINKSINLLGDINTYKPAIGNIKQGIHNDEFVNTDVNKYITDNYKYVTDSSQGRQEDSLSFNKYAKYQYIIWFIFLIIIILMIYRSVTDTGPLGLTSGLVSLTILYLLYYFVTLIIK